MSAVTRSRSFSSAAANNSRNGRMSPSEKWEVVEKLIEMIRRSDPKVSQTFINHLRTDILETIKKNSYFFELVQAIVERCAVLNDQQLKLYRQYQAQSSESSDVDQCAELGELKATYKDLYAKYMLQKTLDSFLRSLEFQSEASIHEAELQMNMSFETTELPINKQMLYGLVREKLGEFRSSGINIAEIESKYREIIKHKAQSFSRNLKDFQANKQEFSAKLYQSDKAIIAALATNKSIEQIIHNDAQLQQRIAKYMSHVQNIHAIINNLVGKVKGLAGLKEIHRQLETLESFYAEEEKAAKENASEQLSTNEMAIFELLTSSNFNPDGIYRQIQVFENKIILLNENIANFEKISGNLAQ